LPIKKSVLYSPLHCKPAEMLQTVCETSFMRGGWFDWQSPFDWQPITWQLLQGI